MHALRLSSLRTGLGKTLEKTLEKTPEKTSTLMAMSSSVRPAPSVPALTIVVLGESGVGKSSIVDKFLFNEQFVRYDAIGTSPSGSVELDGVKYHLLFNDINATPIRLQQPGLVYSFQDKSLAMADGVLLLYDITDERSFERITQWGWEYACACRSGNKLDLVQAENKAKRQVPHDLAEEWASMVGHKSFEVDRFDREKLEVIMRELVHSVKWAKRRNEEDSKTMGSRQDAKATVVTVESNRGEKSKDLSLLRKFGKMWLRVRSRPKTKS